MLFVTALTIIFYRSSAQFNLFEIFDNVTGILTPFIYGIFLAYILNSSLKFLESKVFSKIQFLDKKERLKRGLSIATTYFLLFSFLAWIISYLVPEIKQSITEMTTYFSTFNENSIEELLNKYIPLDETTIKSISDYIGKFINEIVVNLPMYIQKVLASTVGIASVLLNVVLGIIISIYLLFDKENITAHSKKIAYAIMKNKIATKIIAIARESNDTFEKFFVGKIIDSAIIGGIFFIGALVLKAPFALLLSIIIGVTNMIPFFGPFIGGVPVVLLTLIFDISSPSKAVFMGIFILLLQQFDGNILGPKILGDSVGIKPVGIIFAVVVFGAVFGPAGMFFGVPAFAVIMNIFNRFIDRKYEENINIDIKH